MRGHLNLTFDLANEIVGSQMSWYILRYTISLPQATADSRREWGGGSVTGAGIAAS